MAESFKNFAKCFWVLVSMRCPGFVLFVIKNVKEKMDLC